MGTQRMGLCAGCMNDPGHVSLQQTIKKKKVRPLLADLEADFRKHAGDDQLLDCNELTTIWKECARRKVGTLSSEDEAVIEESSRDFFEQLDADKSGKISYAEFA